MAGLACTISNTAERASFLCRRAPSFAAAVRTHARGNIFHSFLTEENKSKEKKERKGKKKKKEKKKERKEKKREDAGSDWLVEFQVENKP